MEGYAASIGAKGVLQNLVVEPELDAEGTASGFDLVIVGEGRRLAQLLRAEMAAAAEQRLAATDWLPLLLRVAKEGSGRCVRQDARP
ncbi:hypothetical protein [Bradyrhizobium sp. SZCCHNR3015]|uniref:hypothetical protein n=1 Tax=unclassified Bradyrhizobium TaxID=2631580 RepID=UPI003966C46B